MLALVDSPWYKDGFVNPNDTFDESYDASARADLPLAGARTIAETRDLVEAAGFTDVRVTELHDLFRRSEELGLAPLSGGQMQYLITARP